MLWVGAEIFRIRALSPWAILVLASGCAWLAVDESLMVHECAKWKWNTGALGPDPFVVAYAITGTLVGARIWVIHPARAGAWIHLGIAALGALTAVLADLGVFGPRTSSAIILEEGGELLAIAGAVAALRLAPSLPALRPWAWVVFSALWMGAAAWIVRPLLCPPWLL